MLESCTVRIVEGRPSCATYLDGGVVQRMRDHDKYATTLPRAFLRGIVQCSMKGRAERAEGWRLKNACHDCSVAAVISLPRARLRRRVETTAIKAEALDRRAAPKRGEESEGF